MRVMKVLEEMWLSGGRKEDQDARESRIFTNISTEIFPVRLLCGGMV